MFQVVLPLLSLLLFYSQAELVTKFKDEDSKRYMSFLNKLIKEAGGRFFVGGAVSVIITQNDLFL